MRDKVYCLNCRYCREENRYLLVDCIHPSNCEYEDTPLKQVINSKKSYEILNNDNHCSKYEGRIIS